MGNDLFKTMFALAVYLVEAELLGDPNGDKKAAAVAKVKLALNDDKGLDVDRFLNDQEETFILNELCTIVKALLDKQDFFAQLGKFLPH